MRADQEVVRAIWVLVWGPDFILEEMRSHRLSEHSHYVETVTTGLHGK